MPEKWIDCQSQCSVFDYHSSWKPVATQFGLAYISFASTPAAVELPLFSTCPRNWLTVKVNAVSLAIFHLGNISPLSLVWLTSTLQDAVKLTLFETCPRNWLTVEVNAVSLAIFHLGKLSPLSLVWLTSALLELQPLLNWRCFERAWGIDWLSKSTRCLWLSFILETFRHSAWSDLHHLCKTLI